MNKNSAAALFNTASQLYVHDRKDFFREVKLSCDEVSVSDFDVIKDEYKTLQVKQKPLEVSIDQRLVLETVPAKWVDGVITIFRGGLDTMLNGVKKDSIDLFIKKMRTDLINDAKLIIMYGQPFEHELAYDFSNFPE